MPYVVVVTSSYVCYMIYNHDTRSIFACNLRLDLGAIVHSRSFQHHSMQSPLSQSQRPGCGHSVKHPHNMATNKVCNNDAIYINNSISGNGTQPSASTAHRRFRSLKYQRTPPFQIFFRPHSRRILYSKLPVLQLYCCHKINTIR